MLGVTAFPAPLQIASYMSEASGFPISFEANAINGSSSVMLSLVRLTLELRGGFGAAKDVPLE